MKAKNVLDKLKDLKLRRWGPAEYTEAKNSNEGGSSDDKIDAFNGDYFFPAKSPFIGMVDEEVVRNNIDLSTYDIINPESSPTYTIDTPILKTVDDVDSYMLELDINYWPREHNFVALYNIDEFVVGERPSIFAANKNDENTKPNFRGPEVGFNPIKLNINGKTFVTFLAID